MTIDHVLLTRFNLPTPGVESLVRAQDGWLRNRQALFERYCLPAVLGQSERNFHWIIYFDPQSPGWLTSRIFELARDGSFTPIFRDEVAHQTLLEDIRKVTGGQADILLTTNLDNDDGVAVDFVARLQSAVKGRTRTAIYLVNGLIQHEGRLFLRHDPSNAFCSVSESWSHPVTCWSDWHTKLGQQMQVHHIAGPPAWLQVIHAGNVSNRVQGKRVGPDSYRTLFCRGWDEVREPDFLELLADRLLLHPARTVKGSIRTVGKNVVLWLGGRNTLERLKVLLAKGKGTGARVTTK